MSADMEGCDGIHRRGRRKWGGARTRRSVLLPITALVAVALLILMAAPVVEGNADKVISVEIGDTVTEYGIDELELALVTVNDSPEDVVVTVLNSFSVSAAGKRDDQGAIEITNKNDVRITIDGRGHTIFADIPKTSGKYCNIINIMGCKDILVKDLKIDGEDARDGFDISGSANAAFENVTSTNNSGAGMVVDGSAVTVSGSDMSGNPVGGIAVIGGGRLVLTGDNDLGTGRQIFTTDGQAVVEAEGYVGFDFGSTERMWFENGEIPSEFPESLITHYEAIGLPDEGQLRIPEGMTIPKKVVHGDDGMTSTGLKSGAGGVVFEAGSVAISGTIVAVSGQAEIQTSGDAVLRNLTIQSGTVKIDGDAVVDGVLVISEEAVLSVIEYSVLNIRSGSAVAVAGGLSTSGSGRIVGDGKVSCLTGGDMTGANLSGVSEIEIEQDGSGGFTTITDRDNDRDDAKAGPATEGSGDPTLLFAAIVGIAAVIIVAAAALHRNR